MTRKKAIEWLILIMASAALITVMLTRYTDEPFASDTPPVVNTDGLNIYEVVSTAETACEPVYTMYFDETDIEVVALMLWGEARGCTLEDKQNCVRTVCNRVDDSRFPDSIWDVVTQKNQYYGYSPFNPIDPELYDIAVAVLTDWSLMKQGVDCEWYSYNSFWGDGVQNHFYTV